MQDHRNQNQANEVICPIEGFNPNQNRGINGIDLFHKICRCKSLQKAYCRFFNNCMDFALYAAKIIAMIPEQILKNNPSFRRLEYQ